MKTKNSLIFILTLLVVYFAYRNYELSNSDNDLETIENYVQNDVKDEITEFSNNRIPVNAGKFVRQDTAQKKLGRFKKWNRIPKGRLGKDTLRINHTAFAFGIEKLSLYMNKLQSINSNAQSSKDSIYGVRMYLVNSWKPGDGKPFTHNDLLLVPVDSMGNDWIQLNKNFAQSDSLLLNTSKPCPTKCDQ